MEFYLENAHFSSGFQLLEKRTVPIQFSNVRPKGLLLKSRTGGAWRYHDAAEMFRVAAKAVGLKPGEGMHQLRHTCVSVLIASGANIKQVQAWVGHASITETLDTYGHLFPDSMIDLADKLDSYVAIESTKKAQKSA